MGFDIQMVEPPSAAEVKQVQLDKDDPGYFRFNWSAMPVMVVTMAWAGAIVEEQAPEWPAWPPRGTPADRKQLLEDSLYDKLDPKLTVAEKKATIAMRGELDKLRVTRSKQRGKVPSFKFAANDGYVVTAAECTIIAAKLRSFAKHVTADKLVELEKLYREAQQPLVDAAKQRGEKVIIGNQPLGLTLDEYRAWILEWAAYNDVASHHRGYSIN